MWEYLYYTGAIIVVLSLIAHIAKFASSKVRHEKFFYSSLIRFPRYEKGFTQVVAFPKYITKEIKFKKGFLKVDYVVPDSICVSAGKNSKKVLTLAGILALGDDLTSLLLMSDDITHRPGASVVLSGHLCNNGSEMNGANVFSGETLTIVCKTIKIGVSLGFSEAMFYKNGTTPVAYVRHVKYMKMFYLYDNWIGPLLPLKMWIRSKFSKDGTMRFSDRKKLDTLSLDYSIDLQESLGLKCKDQSNKNTHHYSCTAHKGLQNPWGALHGGASANIAYESVIQSIQTRPDVHACVSSMEINYLSPGSGTVDVITRKVMTSSSVNREDTASGDTTFHVDTLAKDLSACKTHVLEDIFPDDKPPVCAVSKGVEGHSDTKSSSAACDSGKCYEEVWSSVLSSKGRVVADCKIVATIHQ